MDETYVLDSYALLAHLEGEAGAGRVESILRAAQEGKTRLFLSVINLDEIFHITLRELGHRKAEEALFLVEQLPLEIVDADRELTLQAARLKAAYPVAYADCFAAALARREQAKVVTGDPEFDRFGQEVPIERLP